MADISHGVGVGDQSSTPTNDAPVTVEEALRWYAENTAGCRKIGRDGDVFRQALDADGGKRALAALTSAPAGDGTHLTYDRMGSGGRCDWRHLREAVSEAVRGVREVEQDENSDIYTGHRTVPHINYNSLDRIVTAFVDAALARPRAAVGEQSLADAITVMWHDNELWGDSATVTRIAGAFGKLMDKVRALQSPPAKVEE